MSNLKHSKYKNTGLISELLITRIAADTMEGVNSSSLSIFRKFFKKGTALAEELMIYKALTHESLKNSDNALKLIEALQVKRAAINSKDLNSQKYFLNRRILETYTKDFYKTRVPHYRIYAAIHNLLEYQEQESPVDFAKNRQTLIEHITVSREPVPTLSLKTLYERNTQELTYRILIEKFNKKYDSLDVHQKNILRNYITAVSDGPVLSEFTKKECSSIIKELNVLQKEIDSDTEAIKIGEAVNLLQEMSTKKIITEKHITALLQYRELIRELTKAIHG
jgi:hypothetical protein